MKNGRPARNSSSAPWRTSAVQIAAAPVEHGRQRHLRASGLRSRQRAADEDGDAQPDQDHDGEDRVVAMGEQQVGGARVAPLDHHVAQRPSGPGLSGPRARVHSVPRAAGRKPLHHPGLIQPRAFEHLVAGVERLIQRAVIQLAVAAVLRRGQRRQRLLQRFVELRCGKARRPGPSNPIAADGLRCDSA